MFTYVYSVKELDANLIHVWRGEGRGGGKPLNQGTTGIRTVGRLMFPMPRPDRGTIDLYDLCAGVVILSWELSV